MKNPLPLLLLLLFLLLPAPRAMAQSYEELLQALQAVKNASGTGAENAHRAQVEAAWAIGKQIDDFLLRQSARATETVNRLAADMKEDPSRLYYDLQFARAYPDAPPTLDLPWGFFQYLLAVNDPREREALAARAASEKWNWDKLRAEVKSANRDNKEFVFSALPGPAGTYRALKIKRGPYRGETMLDLGFGNYYRPDGLKAADYEIVRAKCGRKKPKDCVFKIVPEAEKDLFNYAAVVMLVIDGDTFKAMIDLGFGITTLQTFRLWGLDSPEINTPEGRETKKFMEELLTDREVMVRAMRMEKYGRYLADVWSRDEKTGEWIYINQTLIDRRLAKAMERE